MATAYMSPAIVTAMVALQRKGGVDRYVEGISIGGCVEAHGTDRVGAMRRSAHAHTEPGDRHRGWVCFKSTKPERIVTATGRPTRLFAHEWAHIAVWGGHGTRWRAMMRRLGHPADAKRYERKGS